MGLGAMCEHLLQYRIRLFGQIELYGASVAGVRSSFHPTGSLHTVDHAGNADGLHFEGFCKLNLANAFIAGKVGQYLPLCLGQV